jgi:hypothetical protein
MMSAGCDRTRELEQRLAAAESLLLEAAWAFRKLAVGGDRQAQAYDVAAHVQTFETKWHQRRQAAISLPGCTQLHATA